MTMAAQTDDPETTRTTFRRCRELFEDIRREGAGEGQIGQNPITWAALVFGRLQRFQGEPDPGLRIRTIERAEGTGEGGFL